MQSRCPKCGSERGDGSFESYTPGVPCRRCGYVENCPRCGLVHEEEVEHVPGAPEAPTKVSASEEPLPSPAEPQTTTEPEGGVVLKLVPRTPLGSVEQRRAICRRILLETLQRIEAGDVEEVFLLTLNSRSAPSPATYRWHFVDPIRMTGALAVAVTKFSMPPFVSIT